MAEPTEAQRKRSQARERRRSQAGPAEDQPGDGATEGGEEPLEAVKHAAKVAAAGAAVGAAAAAARALASRDDESESEPAAEAEEEPAAKEESPDAQARPTGDEPSQEAEAGPDAEQESPEASRRSTDEASDEAPAAAAQDENQEPAPGASPDEATETVQRARRQLSALLERPVESVSAFERTHDGWLVTLEVVEVSRIPESTDVLASYEVELDEDRNLRRYARVRRYNRAQSDRGDQ